MSIQPKEWKIQWGDKEIPVTAEMIVHALDLGISSVYKEAATNRVIRSDARMHADWEQGALILELARDQFNILSEEEYKRQIHYKVPNDKKN